MKQIKTGYTTFEKLRFPQTVYKYREANNPIHLSILSEQILYFAPPASFEDSFDCRIPTRYDLLTDDEIYEQYYSCLRSANPAWDTMYLRDQAIRWCNENLLKDKKRLREKEEFFWALFNERFGVLSLTAINNNLRMWRKYASNFNGFCIGFNPKMIFHKMGGGGPVEYVKKLPLIKPFISEEEMGLTRILTKLEKWAFEKEYRVQQIWERTITDDDRKFKVDPDAYTEIILGYKINSPVKEQLINWAKNLNPKIKISIADYKTRKITINPYF